MCNLQSPIGFLTAYVPEELFHAAGFTPVFVFPTPDDYGCARAHLPTFTCWTVGSALDQALAGTLNHLAGMVIAKTCDATQGLANLWQPDAPHIPLFHFGMPLRMNISPARDYLLVELRDLRTRIEAFTGHPISDDALQESIALYNRVRGLVRRLYARAASPSDGSYSESALALYDLVRAAFQAPKEIYEENLARLLEQPGRSANENQVDREDHPRVLLSGPGLGAPILFVVLDQAGALVVGDLFDLGERYFSLDGAENGNPLEAIADRLMALVPTPTKSHSQRTRVGQLLSLVQERKAHGVIFARQKFCEPHGFDYVQMVQALEQTGIPHQLVELEQASQAGQLRTRVEAFVEMISR